MKKAVLIAALLLSASAAGAVTTFTATPGAPDPGVAPGETVINNFEPGGPNEGTYSGSFTINDLPLSGFRAPPAGDTTNYFAVPANGDPIPNSATIDFADYIAANRQLRSISFYWGSIDSYNTLEVLDGMGAVLKTIVGNDINNPANGNQSNAASNQRVFIRFGDNDNFGSLRFTSTQRAFEIDDIGASMVPEPATWTLLISGMGLVGFAMRRKGAMTHVAS